MSSNTEIISLNQESTINQLLGNPKILNNIKEEKIFLFDNICSICQFQDKYKYLEQFKWDNDDIIPEEIQEEIKNEIEKKKPYFSETFQNTVEILQNKLFEKNNKTKSPLNIYIEYRPGFIFSSILQGKQMILKNITNLSTEVLERFNELLSTEPQLQLNEDFYNTFTNENKKKFENFLNFRIIATCPLGAESKLSEAALSRFTVVTVNDYTENEIEYILNKKNNQNFDEKDIKYIIQFIKNINKEFNKEISIMKIITILNVASSIKINFSNIFNLNIILQLFTKGIIENENNTNKYYDFFDNNYGKIIETKHLIPENAIFSYKFENEEKGVKSKLTGLKIRKSRKN